jgi:hypothetical protein
MGAGALCRKNLVMEVLYIVDIAYEHYIKVTTEGASGGVSAWPRVLARVLAPISPQKVHAPQLFACLVLKSFLKVNYRAVVGLLVDCPGLRETIQLAHVPH